MIHRILLAVLVAVGFGTAVPAAGVSLPVVPDGVEVAGVPVGGLISARAEQELQRRFDQPVRLFFGDQQWTATPKQLGARPAAPEAVRRALDARPGARIDMLVTIDRRALARYLARMEKRFATPATEAKLVGLSASLTPQVEPGEAGRRVDRALMAKRLVRVLRTTYRGMQLELAVVPVEPRVTASDIGPVVVIRRGSNRLFLYDGEALVRQFTVATGSLEYPTPLGEYEIVVKQRDPTWTPPDSDWAKGAEPIPPGPGNPLGTRWMGLSAYAVGIHGTPDAASLGYSASHGCIRMAIPEAEWLFERVEVGTPVYIVAA